MMSLDVILTQSIHFADENITSQTTEMTYWRIIKVNGGVEPQFHWHPHSTQKGTLNNWTRCQVNEKIILVFLKTSVLKVSMIIEYKFSLND